MSLLHRTHHDDDTHRGRHRRGSAARSHEPDVTTVDPRPRRRMVIRERTWTFAPGSSISLVVGIGAIALGLVAMVRAGIDDSFATPVVEVLGFTHTAWLGLAEVGARRAPRPRRHRRPGAAAERRCSAPP